MAAVATGICQAVFSIVTDDDKDNSSSDEEIVMLTAAVQGTREWNYRVKIEGFVEDVVPRYLGDAFQSHFRIKKQTLDVVVNLLGEHVSNIGRPNIPVEKFILASIWILSNQESYRGVADRFGLSRGHLHEVVVNFCNKVHQHLLPKFIKWPSQDRDMVKCQSEFDILRGVNSFPGVIGCVDGSHIPICEVHDDRSSYYNRKGFYSVILQGICDAQYKFLDVFAGWPGASNDARVWSNSPIFNHLANNPLPPNVHLLGDSAYPLYQNLMVPYKDYGNMTQRQKIFNVRLSSTRVVIEQAFGLLKNRFRRMRFLNMTNLELVPKFITTACVLHNICIMENDLIDPTEAVLDDFKETEPNAHPVVGNLYNRALAKRNLIAARF